MQPKKMALGRGLSALIEEAHSPNAPQEVINVVQSVQAMNEIELSKIEVNPFQPRKSFDDEALAELAASIKQLGVIQPITVRELSAGKYQLITGERRFRASKLAGLTKIPAYVRMVDDQDMLAVALVENIQRQDLNAIEVAISYQRLLDECSLTQEDLSDKVGKKRATISNYLRLLKLPAEIQYGIREDKISMGHARTIVSIDDTKKQLGVYNRIIDEGLSVRAVEELVRNLDKPKEPKIKKEQDELPVEYEDIRKKLENKFSALVNFSRNPRGDGKITIPFRSDDELERILSVFDSLK